MSRKIFCIFFVCLISFFHKVSAQCDIPESFVGNTGANMTVFFNNTAISALPISSDSPYLVALTPDGLLAGSVSVALADLQGGQASIAVWGDDSITPEVDGLTAGQTITFQLVDGISLYDLNITFGGANSYVTNGILPVIGASASLNCSAPISGCTDEIACNYDLDAEVNDDSCIYPDVYYDCSGNCLLDFDNDQVCNELEVPGCDDESALNFNPDATDNDGSCIAVIVGCMDSIASNYVDSANTDSGLCEYLGCTDSTAFNYDVSANVNDGSCIDVIFGCTNQVAENYNSTANTDDGTCEFLLIQGCIDSSACNYDSFAEEDDGSCLFNDICGECGGPGPEQGFDCNGICLNDQDGDSICDEFEIDGCQDSIAYNYDSLATDPDSCDYLGCTDSLYFEYESIAPIDDNSCLTLIVQGCTDQDYLEYSDTANFNDGSCLNLIELGCTDSVALNYDVIANIDDGSCYVFGCLDPFAHNTDSLANVDDGSCIYESVVDTIEDIGLDCDLPQPFEGNTGVNMSVFLTQGIFASFPTSLVEGAYVVAVSDESGLTVGSEPVFGVTQANIAVWGDDSQTSEIDGAASNESISYYLVNGNQLFNLDFTVWASGDGSSYVTNGVNAVAAVTVTLNCSSSGGGSVETCEFPSDSVLNTGANMSVFLTQGIFTSFPTSLVEGAYVVAVADESGLTVGSEPVFGVTQANIAIWGDDSQTSEIDGAASNESISYYLVNGDELFNLDFTVWASGDGSSYLTNGVNAAAAVTVTLNCNANSEDNIIGCMHSIACNYQVLASSPSNCVYPNLGYDCDNNCVIDTDLDGVCDEFEISGCQDNSAYNYDYLATDSGLCDYLGCTNENYIEYSAQATIDDGSCSEVILYGCLNSNADNYNPSANASNGSCTFENINEPYIEVLFNSSVPSETYLEGQDIFIEYIVHGGNNNVIIGGPTVDSTNAIIKWYVDGDFESSLFAPFAPGHPLSNNYFSSPRNFENGEHSLQFVLHSIEDGLPLWEPLVQTTINFTVGPSGCTDPLAGNYSSSAVIDDGSGIANAGLDCGSQVINTGSNHTIYVPSGLVFTEDIDFQPDEDLIGVFYLNNGEYVLASEMVFATGISDGSFQIIVYGDDSSTPEIDGFISGQEFIWALQYPDLGNSLYLSPSYAETTSDNTYINDGYFSVNYFDVLYGVSGCNNELYLEYNPQAIAEDPTLCLNEIVEGCINSSFIEYDPEANTDDDSCLIPVLLGCLDPMYLEYDPLANTDNGSCQNLIVTGCTDSLALNYNSLANTHINVCEYDVCVQIDVNNFVIEYSELLGDIVLSFDITNISEDKIIYAPDFEIDLSSSSVELGTLNYNSLVMYPYNVITLQAIIINDSLSSDLDPNFELLSGIVTLSSDSIVNAISPSANCTISFTDQMLPTNHIGCTNSSSFNYEEEATVDDGSCLESLNAVVISNNPLCYDGYGEAFVYLTGGTPPYSLLIDNSDSYISYSELDVPNQVSVSIDTSGVAEFQGLNEGEYSLEVTDDIGAIYQDTITITLPFEIQVNAIVEDDFLLTSSVTGDPSLYEYQWLFNGQLIEGANSDVHYPQEVGNYQVHIMNTDSCFDYSEEVFLSEVGFEEFNEYSFTIYPNPAHSIISLNLIQLNSLTSLSITDVLGQEFNKVILDSQSSNVNYSLDISEWPNGIYFINIENNSNQIVNRFVKY